VVGGGGGGRGNCRWSERVTREGDMSIIGLLLLCPYHHHVSLAHTEIPFPPSIAHDCPLHPAAPCTGGSVAFKNAIPVLPGQTYTVVVGAGGVGEGAAGGNSSFTDVVVAPGGEGGTRSGGAGGATVEFWRGAPYTFVTGGRGGDMSWNGGIAKDMAGGGGGAAGYPPMERPAQPFQGRWSDHCLLGECGVVHVLSSWWAAHTRVFTGQA
jgi:hypothetical protein